VGNWKSSKHAGDYGASGGSRSSGTQTQLSKKSSEIAGEVIFEVLAATNPTIAALYTAYKVAKFFYPIVKEGAKEWDKTRDKDRAVKKMAEETVKQTGKAVLEASVDAVVGATYKTAVDSSGIKTNKIIDTLVTSVASNVIEEVVEGDD